MGMDPATIGLIISGLGSVYGAYQSGQGQNTQANAVNDRTQMIQGYVNQFLQPGTNPYSSALMQFAGMNPIGSNAGYSATSGSTPAGNYGGGAGPGNGYGGGSSGGPGSPGGGNPNGPVNGGSGNPFEPPPNYSYSGGGSSLPGGTPQQQSFPGFPGYSGGWTPQYSQIGGVDTSSYLGQGLRISDLLKQGVVTQDQVNQQMGLPTGYDPYTNPEQQASYKQFLGSLGPSATNPPSFEQWMNSDGGIMSAGLDAQGPNDPAAFAAAVAQRGTNPGYQQGGQISGLSSNYGAVGNRVVAPYIPTPTPIGAGGGPGGQSTLPQTGAGGIGGVNTGGGMGGEAVGGPISGNMYHYQPINAYTYNPAILGAAPQFQAPQIGQGSQPQVTAPAVGTQSYNAGQDGLLQAMNKQINPTVDPSLSLGLQQMGAGNSMFNNTDLFSALGVQDQTALDKQVSQLHASAGSLGQRFGTAMQQNEAMLRGNFLNDQSARNAQISSSSYENAQNRAAQALGTSAGLQGQNQNFVLGSANYGLNAAQAAAQSMFQTQALNTQVGTTNAGNQLAANTTNADLINRILLANQQAGLQGGLANQGLAGQYGLANQNAANTGGQFNAQQQTTNNQFNASQGNQYNNLIAQILSQSNSMQQGSNAYNASLLGVLNGVPLPQAQASPWAGAAGDIGQLLMLLPYLTGKK